MASELELDGQLYLLQAYGNVPVLPATIPGTVP